MITKKNTVLDLVSEYNMYIYINISKFDGQTLTKKVNYKVTN